MAANRDMLKVAEESHPLHNRIAIFLFALAIVLCGKAYGQLQGPENTRVLATQGREVVVSIPDRKLAVVENGAIVRIFLVAVGAAASPSPAGKFQITQRVTKPTYYHKGMVVPSGPANPVGSRWVGLNKKGYGIHGTNDPSSIGKASSHGCIRMSNRDIEQFFKMVSAGDMVDIRAEQDEETTQIFGKAIEPDLGIVARIAAPSIAVGGQ
jgi:lipoprotein-anchoring transpeptidase ErfK/SrfK